MPGGGGRTSTPPTLHSPRPRANLESPQSTIHDRRRTAKSQLVRQLVMVHRRPQRQPHRTPRPRAAHHEDGDLRAPRAAPGRGAAAAAVAGALAPPARADHAGEGGRRLHALGGAEDAIPPARRGHGGPDGGVDRPGGGRRDGGVPDGQARRRTDGAPRRRARRLVLHARHLPAVDDHDRRRPLERDGVARLRRVVPLQLRVGARVGHCHRDRRRLGRRRAPRHLGACARRAALHTAQGSRTRAPPPPTPPVRTADRPAPLHDRWGC